MSESIKKLPFKIIKSNVTGGYADILHQQFTGGVDIVNYHKDTYGDFQDNPLQSPFTEQWVGGYQFRHINVNEGSDQANNRPEGWHSEFTPEITSSTLTETFSTYNVNDKLISETYLEGDGNSEVRQRLSNGKKYFILTNTIGSNTRFLKIKNFGKINSLTYTFIVNTSNLPYEYNGGAYLTGGLGLYLEDPDSGENLVLQYSYDNTNWFTKKTIFTGATITSPSLWEQTETVDFSSELPTYVRFVQTNAFDSGFGGDVDHYGLTDVQVTNTPEQSNVKFYSHGYLNSPPAVWSRDGLAKRPVNIRNIQGANSPIGNYFKNYEIVQTSGRRIANNLIVDGFVAGGELTTQFITGSNNYSLPILNSVTGSKSVIVERFNAPGSKEESSRGALDREGEEMSPNISLPWRNYKIRKPFYSQLSQSTPQFGVSIHGVNRNTVIRAGNTLVDNGFLVRSLPGTDIQYSWITASSETSASELGGYQSFNNSYSLGEAYSDIQFISGSNVLIDGQEEFVDNYGIYSFIKDKKTVDLENKTISLTDIGLSASFGEITNSPYTFTTWTSIRTGENIIARQLRKNNIVSYQDPSEPQVSRNYFDPVVSFKYRPLETKVVLTGAPDGYAYDIKHTYTNNQSTFANKDLIVNFEMPENKTDVYDFLYDLYTNLDRVTNPINDYLGYSYKEIIWPREEFTGLDETRKRKAYYLDRAGYDRDGFDIQLGTQRAFWRDNQQDKKRSLNSIGGYSSSFGYISTEESGSSFSVTGSTTLLDESNYIFTSSFSQSVNIDSGIFNSISLMEYTPSETLLFTSSFEVLSASTDPLIYADEQINISYKRGYRFGVSGELNHSFVDFYGLSKISGSDILRDLGSVYRNSFYKSQLTTKQYELDSARDLRDTVSLIKTEDDELKINPKLRYTTFVGGGELNNSSYVLDNFRDTVDGLVSTYNIEQILTSSYSASISFFGASTHFTTNGLFLVSDPYEDSGSFTTLGATYVFRSSSSGIEQIDKIYPSTSDLTASTDGWFGFSVTSNTLGNKIAIGMPRTQNGDTNDDKGRIYIYSSGSSGINQVQTILGSTSTFLSASEYGFGTNTIMNAAGNRIVTNTTAYGGVFGSEASLERIFYIVSGATGFNSIYDVTSSTGNLKFDYSESKIVVSDTGNKVKIYNINLIGTPSFNEEVLQTSSLSLQAGDEFGLSLSISAISDPKIVCIGAPLRDHNSIANSGIVYIFQSGSLEWELVAELVPNDAEINGQFGRLVKINSYKDKIIIGNSKSELYIFQSGSLGWKQKQKIAGNVANFAVGFGTNQIFASDTNTNRSTAYIYSEDFERSTYVRENLFSQTFNSSDILFSTLDNGLQRTTEIDSGKKPFFDSYDDYLSDVRGQSKDLSVIPEFKISDHIRYYVEQNSNNFLSLNRSSFLLDGVSGSYKSAATPTGEVDNSFYKTYLTSDLLKKHDEIREENSEFSDFEEITVKLSGIKKLLPYNGFYPQDRITQIANLYSEYVDNNLGGGVLNVSYENSERNAALIQNHPELTASLTTVESFSVIEFDNKYYIALGYPYYNSNQGLVKVFSSSAGDILDSTNWSQNSVATYTGDSTGVSFGTSIKLISGSNGINLFASQLGTLFDGAVYQITSSDGTLWSTKTRISSSATVFLSSSAGSSFGSKIDALYDQSENKFILVIAAPTDSLNGTQAGHVWAVTSSDGSSWTPKKQFYNGPISAYTRLGNSLSLVSSSIGYNVYTSTERQELDNPSSNSGSLFFVTSSDGGDTWGFGSAYPVITSGSQAFPALWNVKAVTYDDKTYVFYTETNSQKTFVIYSGTGHDWSTKTKIQLSSFSSSPTGISAVSSSDGLLYYSFSSPSTDSVYLAKSANGIDFETESAIAQLEVVDVGSPVSLIMSGTSPISLYADHNSVYGLTGGKQISLNLLVSGSEVEKAWKHAAIEPLFGPGIMFNTIKSGISVDWPCATGTTAVTTLENGTVINPFYPQPKIMASFQGDNGFYNLQGSLRSTINYRVPFNSIIEPKNMFSSKEELTTNLVETYKVGSTIPSNSTISQFISGTYIYGGYEPYVNPSDVGDIYGQTAKRFSVPFVYQKEEISDSGLYTRAMNNFLAESVKFFLKEEKLTTFISKPSSEWEIFEGGKTYYMDVILSKSPSLVMMEAWHSDKHPIGPSGQKMNGRYFGYPVNKTTKDVLSGEEFTEDERRTMFNDPAYAPYTPPYFEGAAKVRLSVTTNVDEPLTPSELFSKLTITDIFTKASSGWQSGSDAQIHKMPIGSSIDLFGTATATSLTTTRTAIGGSPIQWNEERSPAAGQYWIISPKFETPVLDFSEQAFVSSSNNYLKTSGFGRGMWSGYGKIPNENNSLYISLAYPFANRDTKPYPFGVQRSFYNLLEKVGFEEKTERVGKLADEKVISEAVVMIPYYDKSIQINGESLTVYKNFIEKYLFKVDKDVFDLQKSNIENGRPAIVTGQLGFTEDVETTSITDMIQKAKKYVLPPELDFINNQNIKPIVMYIFEVNHKLTQQDLVDIWQGVMPEISRTAQFVGQEGDVDDVNVISHKSGVHEFFHGLSIPSGIKWMVFKVKQKAEIDYGNVTRSSRDDNNFRTAINIGGQRVSYSYNWPYDFFSLVELGKVEMELKYKRKTLPPRGIGGI